VRHAIALAAALFAAGCATFDGPPEVSIDGEAQGQLPDPHQPLVVDFSKPPVPSSIKLKVARYVTDDEGNLGDEDSDPNTQLDAIFTHDPDPSMGDTGGTATLAPDGLSMSIAYEVVPPAATPLVLLIEPGLADEAGVVTQVRRRIVFTYVTPLTCNAPAHVIKSGTYFMIALVTKPIAGVHVNLYAVIDVDPMTGQIKAQFTKAKRNPDPNRCPMSCPTGDVCRLVPSPMCVAPSEPAGSVDEYSDYVPDPDPPAGFGFATTGCTADQEDGSASFVTREVDVVTQMPMVTLRNAKLTASFTADDKSVLRGTGSLVADAVLLGTFDSGKGEGDLTARSIPDADVPMGLPQP
jgi:hypothetical protein